MVLRPYFMGETRHVAQTSTKIVRAKNFFLRASTAQKAQAASVLKILIERSKRPPISRRLHPGVHFDSKLYSCFSGMESKRGRPNLELQPRSCMETLQYEP